MVFMSAYPASIRAEVAKAVEYRKEKRKPTPQTPEIVTWFMEDFLPRLAEEVRELGWVRRLVRQVHGSRIYEMTLLA